MKKKAKTTIVTTVCKVSTLFTYQRSERESWLINSGTIKGGGKIKSTKRATAKALSN